MLTPTALTNACLLFYLLVKYHTVAFSGVRHLKLDLFFAVGPYTLLHCLLEA